MTMRMLRIAQALGAYHDRAAWHRHLKQARDAVDVSFLVQFWGRKTKHEQNIQPLVERALPHRHHVAHSHASTWHLLVLPHVTRSCLHVSLSRASTFMRETSDLAVWDLAEIPIVVKSRHFVERRDFPPLW